MNFKFLAQHLHTTAIAAHQYFKEKHGAKKFKVETEVARDLPLVPTFSADLANGYILCVEVSMSAYSNTVAAFISDCSNRGLPIKFYVVIPSARGDADFALNLKRAKQSGVGIVQIDEAESVPYSNALSLSHCALRRLELKEFPAGKRELLQQAEETFLNGNPVKGCQSLFEELESYTRKFAQRSKDEGWWRSPHRGEKGPKAKKLATDSWANVLSDLSKFLDEASGLATKCPKVNDGLIAAARSSTDPRNLTSHDPGTLSKIVERDKKLRTWFENTGDILKKWYEATSALKLK